MVTGYAKSGDSCFEDRTEKKIAGCDRTFLIVATISGAKKLSVAACIHI
jgi:hypothetical protein